MATPEVQVTVRTVAPVLSVEERDAAVIALRWVLEQGALVARDEDLVRHALEAHQTAPDGPARPQLEEPDRNALGGFRRESDESRQAALRNYPRSGSQRLTVLMRVFKAGDRGATREELAEWLALPISTVNPRVRELLDGGWLEVKMGDAAKAVTRRTRAGNAAAVVVVSDRGRNELRRRGARP